MKLANGMGSVYKLSGRRRKPWVARKTKGWDIDEKTGKTKQLYMTIGYFPTRQEALTALINYNENPYDIEINNITFEEVYDKWSSEHFLKISQSGVRSWISAFNHSKPLHKMRMKDIRANHLEGTIHNANVGEATKQRMKSLYNLMYRYCLKNDIVDKDYAALCESVSRGETKIKRVPFSDEEIMKLWDNITYPFTDMVLIGIYSGWRPQELAILKIADIDLDNWSFTGGLKLMLAVIVLYLFIQPSRSLLNRIMIKPYKCIVLICLMIKMDNKVRILLMTNIVVALIKL